MKTKHSNKEIKNHPNDDVRQIADDLDKASAISAFSESEGGKILIKALVKDVVGCVDALCSHYKQYSQLEIVGVCAEMKNKIDILRSLTGAKAGKESLESILDEAMRE